MLSTYLEHLVGRGLDSQRHVGRTERNLLHILKVVLRIAVEDDFANGDEGILLVGPHLQNMHKKGMYNKNRLGTTITHKSQDGT